MNCPESPIQPLPSPAETGDFAWKGVFVAIVAAPLFGLVWAWVAEVAQFYVAPIILFPLVLGALAGLSIVGLVRFAQVGHRPTIILAAVLAAGVAAGTQHYLGYLAAYSWIGSPPKTNTAAGPDLSALAHDIRPTFGQYMEAQARRGRPLVGDYVAKGWLAWLSWAVDALLVIAGAVAVALPAIRVPYCNRCGTWYRTVRGGKIDVPTGLRLAELLGVEEIGPIRSPRYRLSACHGGCGPTRCELSWEQSDGTVNLVQVWLDAAGRNRVAAVINGLESKSSEHSNP